MEQPLLVLFALVAGLAVAAVAGLRAFLPLLAVGLAARFGHLELHPGVLWLASDPALLALGFATVIEIAADKIPIVDHVLDAIGTFVRPVAGALAAYGVLAHWPTPWAQITAILLGTGTLAVHLAKSKVRLGSSAVTLGHANPLLSVGEDIAALVTLAGALLAPIVGLFLVVILVWMLARLAGRSRRSPRD
jgi:hypothetical protein